MSDRASFNWQDPFLLEDQLNDDERMIRDSAASFAKAELLPRVQEAYLSETSEPELFRLMGQAGLLALRCRKNTAQPMPAMSLRSRGT